jgi:hypothetical protein
MRRRKKRREKTIKGMTDQREEKAKEIGLGPN